MYYIYLVFLMKMCHIIENDHIQFHSGEKPIVCQLCDYRLGGYVIDHIQCHTGEKPIICGVCDFGLYDYLGDHM